MSERVRPSQRLIVAGAERSRSGISIPRSKDLKIGLPNARIATAARKPPFAPRGKTPRSRACERLLWMGGGRCRRPIRVNRLSTSPAPMACLSPSLRGRLEQGNVELLSDLEDKVGSEADLMEILLAIAFIPG